MDLADPPQDPDAAMFGARAEALEVLADIPEWRLTAGKWQEVGRALHDLAEAAGGGDDEGLLGATARLEALSPFRIVPIDPGIPAPRSLRLRLNHLVHTLTGPATPAAAWVRSSVAAPAPQPGAGAVMVRQELVVHAFVAVDGPWAQPAYDALRAVWARARELLGTTAQLGEPAPPADLPEDCRLLPSVPLPAAAQRPDRTVQLVLRRDHDTLVLSAGWRADPGATAPDWPALRRQWAAVLGEQVEGFLGVVEVLAGTGDLTDRPDARELLERLTVGADALWAADGVRHGSVALWELPPFDEHHRAGRCLLALAPERDHAQLSTLIWADGGSAVLPPLARYLAAAAKVRYELRVRLAAADAITAAVDSGDEAQIAVLTSRLDSLRRTVGIARSNMAAVLEVPGGLFDDDRETAAWVEQILDDDLYYLGNARDRARHTATRAVAAAVDAAAPVVALVTALPEEYEAMAAVLDDAREYHADHDHALYQLGSVPSGRRDLPHRVVLTMLGGTANNDAAAAVTQLLRSFPTVSEVVMVGVAAGVPAPRTPDRHVRLGDVVVSAWGIVDFDHVVDRPDDVTLRQAFPRPSYRLGVAAKTLEADDLRQVRPWEEILDRLVEVLPAFARPDPGTDVLYESDDAQAGPSPHPDPDGSGHRPGRPKVHYGRIGSGNRSLRNIVARDDLTSRHDVRAVEMEGAGVGWAAHRAGRGWLVVRGVSDYADSRMVRNWRRHAAAAAAAYTKALLGRCVQIDPYTGG